MTCPQVQREPSVLVSAHLGCLAVKGNRATQHSLRSHLTPPLTCQASVALPLPLLAHLLVLLHPALDPSLQPPCQVRPHRDSELLCLLMMFRSSHFQTENYWTLSKFRQSAPYFESVPNLSRTVFYLCLT